MKKFLTLVLFVFAAAKVNAADDPMFPFVLPWDDASPGITNISDWSAKPAGASGFIQARGGHLFEGAKRIRFLGVNTVFGANFPTHEDADKIAARMAKFGINCVRLHHMDCYAAPRGIMAADMKGLDPEQLDRLDYFVAKLKERGIYSNLNLHVSRTYPGMPAWEKAPNYFKGVDLFYTPMLELQRDFARELLTHVNPYTKNAYINEPAVALIEINNENGLILEWKNGTLDQMPEAYAKELTSLWNAWLSRKYAKQADLKMTWDQGAVPLGNEMIRGGDSLANAVAGGPWTLEQHGGAKAVKLAEEAPDGGYHIEVQTPGTEDWHVQLSQAGLAFEAKNSYTLSFRARADKPCKISVVASKEGAPWTVVWSSDFNLTQEWKTYRTTFQGSDEIKGRIVFGNMGTRKGDIWLDGVSLKPGGLVGLGEGEVLGTIPCLTKKDYASHAMPARKDWMAFLWDTEEGYWTGMADFVKKDLKAQSLVLGTATGFSPSLIQAKLDVVDSHSYWQHPKFPGKSWDAENWTVNNEAMAGADKGGAFSDIALRRVTGKPFICTEYNGSAPNTHSGETFLLIAAYAALQDWDGVFAFAWSHKTNDWDGRKIDGFFDIDQHPLKLATFPAAAALFRRGDVAAARRVVQLEISRDAGITRSIKSGPWWSLESFGISRNIPLQSRTEMKLGEGPASLASTDTDEAMGGSFVSDTSELTWDLMGRRVLINTARSKAVIGKTILEPVGLGEISVQIKENQQSWAAVSLTVMEGTDFHSPGKILITASGNAENTAMGWKGPDKRTVGKDWGKAPSLIEGIKASIFLPVPPEKAQAWALDDRGQRGKEIPLKASGEGSVLEIGPEYQTLWYEVDLK